MTLLGFWFTNGVTGFFDHLSLYVGADEGFALSHIDTTQKGNKKVYDMFSYRGHKTMFGHHEKKNEVYQMKTNFDKIKITAKGLSPNTYHVELSYYNQKDISHKHKNIRKYVDGLRYFRAVPLSGNASLAIQCQNKKYLK